MKIALVIIIAIFVLGYVQQIEQEDRELTHKPVETKKYKWLL